MKDSSITAKSILLLAVIFCFMGNVNAQIYSANDSLEFSNWSSLDLDDDGESWQQLNLTDAGTVLDSLQECIRSRSYDDFNQTALTPDNVFISPEIDCSTNSSVYLRWMTGSTETTVSGWSDEHYAVYVVNDTVGLASGVFPTPVFETTLLEGATLFQEEVEVTSQTAGQTSVYIVIRHFDCTDENWLVMDNFVLFDGGELSVDALELNAQVYPNPVESLVHIRSKVAIQKVELFTMNGKSLDVVLPNALVTSLDVRELNSGTYILEIDYGTHKQRHRIVKN